MLTWLLQHFSHNVYFFHIAEHAVFRSIMSAMTAFVIVLVVCPKYIRYLRSLQMGQVVRQDGPDTHLKKTGTPTMGGALILFAILISVLLWCQLTNYFVWLALWVTIGFGVIGGVDDYRKVAHNNTKGLSAKKKLLSQSLVALCAILILFFAQDHSQATLLFIPFLKNISVHLGLFYIALAYFVIVGTSNAVNLTDGLDGLALLPIVMVIMGLSCFAYVSSNLQISNHLDFPFISHAGELVVFCSAVAGAGLGFLWYNAYPAQIFMGDVGSLSLGGAIGVVAVMVRQELLLFVMGGIFVAETVSVILQVGSFKLRGKRIFKMAPLHHHFELKGWAEPKVIVRFWIITMILVVMGLSALGLR